MAVVMHFPGMGHPWTADPGWDQLFLGADDMPALREKVAEAEGKFWRVWFLSEANIRAHLYKPAGAKAPWEDLRWEGTPRGHGHQFREGDEVYSDYATTKTQRRITHHRVTGIRMNPMTQSGVQLRVTPPVPGSQYVDDRSESARGAAWLDSAWFRKVPA